MEGPQRWTPACRHRGINDRVVATDNLEAFEGIKAVNPRRRAHV